MARHVAALFRDHHSARVAVDQLIQAGFTRDAMSLIMSRTTHDCALGTPASVAAGVFSGIASGLSAMRAFAPPTLSLFGVGPLIATLAQREAERLAERVRAGGILVAVYAHETRVNLALQLLSLTGGESLEAA